MFDSLLTGAADGNRIGVWAAGSRCGGVTRWAQRHLQAAPAGAFLFRQPVLARDVKFSFDALMGPYTSPAYKTALDDVAGLDIAG